MLTFGSVVGQLALAGKLDGSCSSGTCSQDEATLLQMQSMRHKSQASMTSEVSVPNEATQCWGSNQCGGQGGACPQYCGDGVCCRAGFTAQNDMERDDCGQNGWGITGMHTCQPARSSYVGCFVDDGSRDLEAGPRAYGYTRPTCATACASYTYYALQNNGWCVCGTAYSTAGQYSQVADTECGNSCAGETEGRCGAGWRNAIYRVNSAPAPSPPGPPGAPGTPGGPGATGPSGSAGAQGAQGLPGAVGAQGAQGHVGSAGSPGERGLTGPQGLVGVAGQQGQRGDAGPPGAVGPQGTLGATGPRGESGMQGLSGLEGNTGARGDTGAQGPQGVPGALGERGVQGEPGVPGEVGSQGAQGAQGQTGAPGAPGAVGVAGPQGADGVGIVGPAGADGMDGSPAPPPDPALEGRVTILEDLLSHGYTMDGCSTGNNNNDPDRGDQSGELIPLMARDVADTAAVRCCSYDGSSCVSDVEGCHESATFFEAQVICNDDGKRLCTAEEIDVCCGTGCWYNHFAVWIK